MEIVTTTHNPTGAELIAAERARQVSGEGYTAEHDKGHVLELIRAANCYTQYVVVQGQNPFMAPELFGHPADLYSNGNPLWPWGRDDWKPGEAKRDLIKAGALLAAALDAMIAEEDK